MPGYKYEIVGQPDYSFAKIQIPANESLLVETGAMATMDTHIQMKTKSKGMFGRFLQGESLFLNRFTAVNAPGEIEIAPGPPGDLGHMYLENQTIYLQSSSFVACTEGVDRKSKWQGMVKGFFGGAGLFLIQCSGTGNLWFNSFGGIFDINVDGETLVDNGHIVAFTSDLDYEVTKVGGYKSLFLSGEGLACRFRGQGKVWVQNRKVPAFVSWINPYRRIDKKSYLDN